MSTPPLSLPQRSANPLGDSVHFARLEDGRRLAYAEFGDRHGYPLFHFHSHGSSRLEAASLHRIAKRCGFRIIAVDRPGVGLSDPARSGDVGSFARDMAALAEQLRCSRYGLLACGGGLATALAFADLSGANASMLLGVSCSVPAIGRPEGPGRMLLRTLAQGLVRGAIVLRHWRAASALENRLHRLIESLSYADRRMFENPAVMQLMKQDVTEALRQGAGGIARDTAQQLSPLALECARLTLPCHFWIGSSEKSSVRQQTENLTLRLPNAQLHRLANRGRYFYMRHTDEVFASANQLLGRTPHPVVHKADFAFRRVANENAALTAIR